MNQWQEMFLPIKLRNHLLEHKTDKPFFSESKILLEFPSNSPSSLNGFQIIAIVLLLLALGISFMALKGKAKVEKALWIFSSIVIFLFGVFGLVMLLNWILSGHIDLHHNVNMILLWPIDLFLMWPLAMIILKGKKLEPSERIQKIWTRYIELHLIVNILFIILSLIGVFSQSTSNLALYIAPLYSVFLFLIKSTYTKNEASMGFGIQ